MKENRGREGGKKEERFRGRKKNGKKEKYSIKKKGT